MGHPLNTTDARPLVERMLADAVARRASDVHVEPTAIGCEIRYRIDGLLELVARHSAEVGRTIATRLMVLARLLTYRPDIPQEGRATITAGDRALDVRISIMPTTHGPRAAVRLPAELIQPRTLDDLNLPANALAGLKKFAASDAGMLIVTGPAGSGKTTTVYALLEHIAATSQGLSIITLEDPVERDIVGVTQIEISPFGERTYELSLRSLLRQDPQVLMLGEIRDAATATLAVQAALSGHRLICTLHAATPGGAIARLLEMNIEPYQLTSSVSGILAQRLLRKRTNEAPKALPLQRQGTAPESNEVLYTGRTPIAEFITLDAPARTAILSRADANTLQKSFTAQPGYTSLHSAAAELVSQNITDQLEVLRVLGATEK